MRRSWFLVAWCVLSTVIFAGMSIQITSESTVVNVQDSVLISVAVVDNETGQTIEKNLTLSADVSVGGFADPEIFFSGVTLKKGKAEIVYIAPSVPGEAVLMLSNAELGIEASYTLLVQEKESLSLISKASLAVFEFVGEVALRKSGQELWNPISKNDRIEEGDEILTMRDSYVILEGMDGVMLTIPPQSQVLFERLRTDGKRMDVSIKVKKGETVSEISRILTGGSKFQVGAGSVVAGVRGTKFAVEAGDTCYVRTFKGEVIAEVGGKVIPIPEGRMGAFTGTSFKILNLDRGLDYYEKTKERIKEKETKKKEAPTKGRQEGAISRASQLVNLGSITKSNTGYMVYSFTPSFKLGPVELGIGINAYQKEITGPLYFGVPPSDPTTPPSTNILSAFNIAWVAYSGKYLDLRYGYMQQYTYGLGLLMKNYTKKYSRAVDVALKLGEGKHVLSVHLPFEALSFVPFEYEQTSPLFFANYTADTGFTWGGPYVSLTGVVDTEEFCNESTPSTAAMGGFSLAVEERLSQGSWGKFVVGAELAGLMDQEQLGYGAFFGAMGNFHTLDWGAGVVYIGEHFVSSYYGSDYEKRRPHRLPDLTDTGTPTWGSLVNIGLTLEPFLKAQANLVNYQSHADISPILSTEALLRLPKIGNFNGLALKLAYLQYKFELKGLDLPTFFNERTYLDLRIGYPISEFQYLVYNIGYDYENDTFQQTISYESSF